MIPPVDKSCVFVGLWLLYVTIDDNADAHDIQVSVMRSAKLGDVVRFESKIVRLGRRQKDAALLRTQGSKLNY